MANFPQHKKNKKPIFKFNIFWMYALIMVFLGGMYFLNNGGNTINKEVDLSEFNKYISVDKGITNIIIR